jgi:surface antigen
MRRGLAAILALLASCLAGCSGYGMSGGPPPPAAATPASPSPVAPVPPVAATPLPPAAAPVPSGAALGGVLGGPIGASLSEADRQTAWQAQLAALDSGQRRSWRGSHGVFGFVEPGAETGGGCRAYSQTIYISGRPNRGHGVACKEADGSWRMTS